VGGIEHGSVQLAQKSGKEKKEIVGVPKGSEKKTAKEAKVTPRRKGGNSALKKKNRTTRWRGNESILLKSCNKISNRTEYIQNRRRKRDNLAPRKEPN